MDQDELEELRTLDVARALRERYQDEGRLTAPGSTSGLIAERARVRPIGHELTPDRHHRWPLPDNTTLDLDPLDGGCHGPLAVTGPGGRVAAAGEEAGGLKAGCEDDARPRLNSAVPAR